MEDANEGRMNGIDYRIDDLERDITKRIDALQKHVCRIDDMTRMPLPSDQSQVQPEYRTVTLDMGTAHTLLTALEGPGHLIREMQAIRGTQDRDSPIYKLRMAITAAMRGGA